MYWFPFYDTIYISLVLVTVVNFWANLADDKLLYFFLFFPENRLWHFMQIVSIGDNLHEMSKPVFNGDNLHEMSKPVFWKKEKKNISVCRLLKILPRMLSVKKRDCHSSQYKSAIRADKNTNYFVCIIYITPNWGIIEKKKQTKGTLFIISVCTNLS